MPSLAHLTEVSNRTQRARLLGLLIKARGAWVPLPAILKLGIAQFGARIYELRRLGFTIQNKIEMRDGVRHSWYCLPLPQQGTLFPEPESEARP